MSEIFSLHIEDIHSNASNSSETGQTGEELAARFLIRRGFRLVCSNFKVPIGRNRRGAAVTGEIDLVALEAGVLCFIEVKTRSTDEFASPLAAVDRRKQRQITRTARMYRKLFGLQDIRFRYDVVSIVLNDSAKEKIELFRAFWTEEIFRKKFWSDDF